MRLRIIRILARGYFCAGRRRLDFPHVNQRSYLSFHDTVNHWGSRKLRQERSVAMRNEAIDVERKLSTLRDLRSDIHATSRAGKAKPTLNSWHQNSAPSPALDDKPYPNIAYAHTPINLLNSPQHNGFLQGPRQACQGYPRPRPNRYTSTASDTK